MLVLFAVTDARTAAYGSAYCIVLLILGASAPPPPPSPGLDDGGGTENPLGAGSENAPYASMLGRGNVGVVVVGAAAYEGALENLSVELAAPEYLFASEKGDPARLDSDLTGSLSW